MLRSHREKKSPPLPESKASVCKEPVGDQMSGERCSSAPPQCLNAFVTSVSSSL